MHYGKPGGCTFERKQQLHPKGKDGLIFKDGPIFKINSTVVSCRYAPKTQGGLYVGCDSFSRDYALPSGKE